MPEFAGSPSSQVPARLRTAIFGLLALLTAASLVGVALSPYWLVKHPLVLVALSPATRHVALAAPSVDALALISVGTLRSSLMSAAMYGLGIVYGAAAVTYASGRYPRLGRFVRWVQRVFVRWGLLAVLLWPVPGICLFAGAAKTRLWAFVLASVAGNLLWTSTSYYVGDFFAEWTSALTRFLSDHLVESTAVCAALVAIQQAIARFRRSRPDPERSG